MKKIEVFLRLCYYSKLQELPDRKRPTWFDEIKVFENFKNTIDPSLANYTIVYDEFYGNIDNTFLRSEKNVEFIRCGSECDSFLRTLEIIQSRNFDDDQIIYFLEDDYLHKPNWCDMILEGFTLNPSYLTLYDFDCFVEGFLSQIFITQNSHWRAVPTTTNTFACKYKTLIDDLEVHKKYSSDDAIKEGDGYHFSRDYEKFWELADKQKKYVISPMPGWSTHCDNNHLSPIVDWKEVINTSFSKKEKSNFILKY